MKREIIINIDRDWVLPAESQLTSGRVVKVIATPRFGPPWAKVRGVYVAGTDYIQLFDERSLVPDVSRREFVDLPLLVTGVRALAYETIRCLWCGRGQDIHSGSKLYIIGKGRNDIERQWDALIPEYFHGAVLCSAGCVNSLFDLLYKQETLKRLPQLEEMILDIASLKDDFIALAEKKKCKQIKASEKFNLKIGE